MLVYVRFCRIRHLHFCLCGKDLSAEVPPGGIQFLEVGLHELFCGKLAN